MGKMKQKRKMINFDELAADKTKYKNANGYLVHPFRAIVCGSSGCGKTNAICNILLNEAYKLDYGHVYLFAKDLSEDKYQFIIQYFTKLEQKVLKKTGETVRLLTYSDKLEDVPTLSKINKNIQNIAIFDDWTNEPVKRLATMKDYFTMGRKFNVSTFYLCHSWYACPKVFRLNTQYAFIYQLPSARELRELYKELGMNIERDDFWKAYREATKNKFNFLLIDKKTNNLQLQYRSGLDGLFSWRAEAESDEESE